MKFFNFLIVSLFCITTILLNTKTILYTSAKCVMREPCYSKDQNVDNPFDTKWYNCKYEGEPMPLKDRKGIEDFKELCSPLYEGDDTPVCCSSNQLATLKKDLRAAEAVGIGACSSCYFNFRMLWCYMACHRNQSEFVIPLKLEYRNLTNFDSILEKYKESHHINNEVDENNDSPQNTDENDNDNNDEKNNEEEPEEENEENKSETADHHNKDENENKSSTTSKQSESDYFEDEKSSDESKHNEKRKKRSLVRRNAQDVDKQDRTAITHLKQSNNEIHHQKKEGWVVKEVEFHIKEEHVQRLIDACRDVKLYGNDALQPFCGKPSKLCTPIDFAQHIGLKVDQRPFDIYFRMNSHDNNKTIINQERFIHSKYENLQLEHLITPIRPVSYLCNESYDYGFDYGAKCSCKSCRSSCEIYPEFRIPQKHQFKIGKLDGVSFIMTILFFIFLVTFYKTLIHFKKLGNKKKSVSTSPAFHNRKQEKRKLTIHNLISCCVNFFSFNRQQNKTQLTNNDTSDTLTPIAGNNNEKINKDDDINGILTPQSIDSTKNIESTVKENGQNKRKRDRIVEHINQLNFLDRMRYVGEKLESYIQMKFEKLGRFCATYPKLVLVIGFMFCFLMCLGYFNFKVEKDPIKLWSSDKSIARQNKKYFDENFNPFYRITQLIIEPKETIKPYLYTHKKEQYNVTALQSHVLLETFKLYDKINSIVADCDECEEDKHKQIKLEDICFQPLSPDNTNCAIQSIFQYWQNDKHKILADLNKNSEINTLERLDECMRNPFTSSQFDTCLSAFGSPIQPYMIVGSYNDESYLNAGAIVITYVINNYISNNKEYVRKAMAWEGQVLELLKNYSSEHINVFYTTERSIEDELERESKADIKIIAISYAMMFVYLTITLGKYTSLKLRVILVEMKIFLGLAGVILVLMSVFSSGGLFTYLGVPATLITLEVIPFLLLAVGVDNIYVMVQTYQNDERLPSETVEDQIARIVGKVGPSMLLTGTTQSAAFLISALTPMPGVRAFSLYASLAIVLNFLMQITCFVVLLTLDAKREKAKRVDLLCFIKLNVDSDIFNNKKSFLHKFFKNVYTPLLLNDYVRAVVIVVFVGFFFACIAMCEKLKVGLDQKLAMPTDSYQIQYFEALQKHLAVGPPVYFVVKSGYNYTNVDLMRKICGGPTCESNSLQSIISAASAFPNETYIAQSSVNWIDDYMEWLSAKSDHSKCCYLSKQIPDEFCDFNKFEQDNSVCQVCNVNQTNLNFPDRDSFLKYIDYFLTQNPSEKCIKAGHAMYGSAIKLIRDKFKNVVNIGPSHFMAYHTVLSTSNDFVNAMISANQISESVTKMLNKNSDTQYEVFPYSIFYVFYEQYLTIWQDATMQLILTLVAIFISTFILLSFDLFTALIVTLLIAIIIIDMVGIMFMWNIELNAISLVNLVIAIGMSVEFCSHIARAFATSSAKNRKDRAFEALYTMGPPVFSGILQSIVGISVLAFAHSQLFQVFYFRMYFSILILGLTHGLIFLPVLLSYIGRSSNKLQSYKKNSLYFKNISNNDQGQVIMVDPNSKSHFSLQNHKVENETPNHLSSTSSSSNQNLNDAHKSPAASQQVPVNSHEIFIDQLKKSNKENFFLNNRITNNDISTSAWSTTATSSVSNTNSASVAVSGSSAHNNNQQDNLIVKSIKDSPESKKSFDLLLNDRNSVNELDSSNSSISFDNSHQSTANKNHISNNKIINNNNNENIINNNQKSAKKKSNSLSSKFNLLFKLNSPFKEKKLISEAYDLNDQDDQYNLKKSVDRKKLNGINHDDQDNDSDYHERKKNSDLELSETKFVNNKNEHENKNMNNNASLLVFEKTDKNISKRQSNKLNFNECYDDDLFDSQNVQNGDKTLSQSLKINKKSTKPSEPSNLSYDKLNDKISNYEWLANNNSIKNRAKSTSDTANTQFLYK